MDGVTLKTLTVRDNGTTFQLQSGSPFEIRLAENRTTGYHWDLSAWDESVVKKTSDQFIPPETTTPGAGGEHVWGFTANKPGNTSLRLEYRRSWGTAPPAQTYSVNVTVT